MKSKRILALDVGDSRIGVAATDSGGMLASPVTTVKRTSDAAAIAELLSIIKDLGVSTVVVGLPYELDGSVGSQASKVKRFYSKFTAAIVKSEVSKQVSTALFDERYSSKEADSVLAGSKLRNKERRSARDRIAACIILELYLAQQSNSKT